MSAPVCVNIVQNRSLCNQNDKIKFFFVIQIFILQYKKNINNLIRADETEIVVQREVMLVNHHNEIR